MGTALRFRGASAPSGLVKLLGLIAFGSLFFDGPAKAAIVPLYTVNTTSDAVVANACSSNSAGCSLRGAILQANTVSSSVVQFVIPASDPNCVAGVCTINLTAALPDLAKSIEFDGPAADKLIVQRSSGGNYRIFTVANNGTVTATFFGMTIKNGNSSIGGGIYNGGVTANVINCTITGNTATADSGGGIYSEFSTLNVTNSTVSGNTSHFGGGIGSDFGSNGGTLNVTNSTITGNSATSGDGGGIRTSQFGTGVGTVKITNSTITGNSATGGGGGISRIGGTWNVKNCIIAMNTSNPTGPDVSGDFISAGFNLIGKTDGSTGFTAATDQTGTIASPLDPKLDPNGLQSNGGATKTIALLFGSPAIDKGTSAGLTGNLTTDQRGSGFQRTFNDTSVPNANGGDGTDIGAFEVQTSQPTRLANISTRLPVQTGDNVLIGGLIITGTQPKKVILRAIGPSLSFPNKLANPTLELFGPSGLIDSNDNWVDSPNKQAIIDSKVPPSDNLESAIVATLPANNAGYTAIVRGVNDGTGIGVVEAYDLDPSVDSRLANISTRGFVQTGDDVLIAGTIIVGPNSQKVIVRAIGPSLSIPGKLQDPTLEMRDQNGGLVDTNDNWVDSPNKQAIIDSGVPPSNDLESAVVATLLANGAGYTAIVRGVNGTTGIAVVEVYALQ
jgi:putative cofactor-binding repeat protein